MRCRSASRLAWRFLMCPPMTPFYLLQVPSWFVLENASVAADCSVMSPSDGQVAALDSRSTSRADPPSGPRPPVLQPTQTSTSSELPKASQASQASGSASQPSSKKFGALLRLGKKDKGTDSPNQSKTVERSSGSCESKGKTSKQNSRQDLASAGAPEKPLMAVAVRCGSRPLYLAPDVDPAIDPLFCSLLFCPFCTEEVINRAERGELLLTRAASGVDAGSMKTTKSSAAATAMSKLGLTAGTTASPGEIAILQLSKHSSSEHTTSSSEKGNICQRTWKAACLDWRVRSLGTELPG